METSDTYSDTDDTNWYERHRVAELLTVPAVRQAVAACTANATTSVSAEAFLSHVAGALPLKHMQTLYIRSISKGRGRSLKRGLSTGKDRTETFPTPIGQTIAAILCSLARRGQIVRNVVQHETACP